MLLIFIGPDGSGKMTVAKVIAERTGVAVWTFKTFFRLAKHEQAAWRVFLSRMKDKPVSAEPASSAIYLITDLRMVQDDLLDAPNVVLVKFTAPLEVIQDRMRKTFGGVLPSAVNHLIERQHSKTEALSAELEIDTSSLDTEEAVTRILTYCREKYRG